MRWVNRLMTSVAAVLLTAGGASALTQDPGTAAEAAWSAAAKVDSLEAYAEFLMAFPDSDHARAAYNRLAQPAMASSGVALQSEDALVWNGSQAGRSSPEILPGTIMII